MGASWIKLSTALFYDQKVQLIMAREDGHGVVLVWIRLMMLAGETNDNGYIYLTEKLPLSAEDLSILMRMSVEQIQSALTILEKYGMIETYPDGKIFICNWAKHQNTSALERLKTKERVRRYRAKQQNKQVYETDLSEKIKPTAHSYEYDVTPCNEFCNANVPDSVTENVTLCNEEDITNVTPENKNIDIENKNKEKEEEKEKIILTDVGIRQPQNKHPPFLAPLHDEIAAEYERRFTDMLPSTAWGSITKERAALIKLSRNTKYLSHELHMNPFEMIPQLIGKYLELRRFGKTEFWRDAPLTPSQLLSRWDQVIATWTKEPKKEEVLF